MQRNQHHAGLAAGAFDLQPRIYTMAFSVDHAGDQVVIAGRLKRP